jgi:hypothetical protein
MPRVAVVAFVLALLAGPALAQGLMGAAEARRTFMGIDMQGVHQPSGEHWRECIDRAGRTTYWFAGSVDEGRLTIRADGALCFAYASTGFRDVGCWRIRPQAGANYRFENAAGESGVFVTTSTRRVSVCEGPETPTS